MFALNSLVANQLKKASMLKSEANANYSAVNEFKNDDPLLSNLSINSELLEKKYP